MKKLLLLLGIAIAVVLSATVVAASIPDSQGVIHGCYKNNTGDLRVIDSAANCPSGYTALNWQQFQDPVTATHQRVSTITNDHTIQGQEGFGQTTPCPSGTVVTGGGYAINDNADVRVVISSSDGNGWAARIFAPNDPVTFTLFVYADCLTLN